MFNIKHDEKTLKSKIKFIILDKEQKELYCVLVVEDNKVKGLIVRRDKIGYEFSTPFVLRNEYIDDCLKREVFDITNDFTNAIKWLMANK